MNKLLFLILFTVTLVLGLFLGTQYVSADCSGQFECGTPVQVNCYDPIQNLYNCDPNADPDCSCQTQCQSTTNPKSCTTGTQAACLQNRCKAGCQVTNTCTWSTPSSGGYCGDGICNNGETSSSCPGDCPVAPTATPTPVPACQCTYTESCTTSINTPGTRSCSGINSGSTCVYDNSGACSPSCSTCVGSCGCTYTQGCTTSGGQSGTQTCSGSTNSSGTCVWDSTGGCSPSCSVCTASSGPTPTPTKAAAPTPTTAPASFSCSLSSWTVDPSTTGGDCAAGTYCVDFGPNYSGSYTTPVNQYWNFGDGATGTNSTDWANTYHGYTYGAGNLTVKLQATANGGSPTTSCSKSISVPSSSSPTPTSAPSSSCGTPSSCGSGQTLVTSTNTCTTNANCSSPYNWCNAGCCTYCKSSSSSPTPTPTTAPAPSCGDNSCDYNAGESCSSCPADCGVCTYSISGQVYSDANNNGIYNPPEPYYDCNGNGTWDPSVQETCQFSLGGTCFVYADCNKNGQLDATPVPEWYSDQNGNGKWDANDSGVSTNLSLSGSKSQTTSSNSRLSGFYSFSNLPQGGNYRVSVTIPNGYQLRPGTPNPAIFNNLSGNRTADFPLLSPTPAPKTYTVSGNVFVDANSDSLKDNGETNYAATPVINASGGTVTAKTDGTFQVTGLTAGTHNISYSSLPSGYRMIYPKNGTPPSFNVIVGSGCKVDTTTGGSCDPSNNIINLNFAINNSLPWSQTEGNLDVRFDSGFTTNIPASPNPTCGPYAAGTNGSPAPAVLYTGDADADFGSGQGTANNWLVGGSLYPEVYGGKSSLSVSYSALSNKLTAASIAPTDMSAIQGCSVLSNCSLPANLSNGVYIAHGSVTLTGDYTFPAGKNYVFLINGSLVMKGALIVPHTSTDTFIAKNDITVDKSVGATTLSCNPIVPQIEGMFSAGGNFIIEGNGDPVNYPDSMLNLQGSLVINAERQGGSFINKRDLGSENGSYPVFTITARPDFALHAPELLKETTRIQQEVAP